MMTDQQGKASDRRQAVGPISRKLAEQNAREAGSGTREDGAGGPHSHMDLPQFTTMKDSFAGRKAAARRLGSGMSWLLKIRIVLMLVALGAVIWTMFKLR